MRIASVTVDRAKVALTKPYTIARETISHVEIFYVRLETNEGLCGLGCASPAEAVTGESLEDTAAALSEASGLVGEDPRALGTLLGRLYKQWSACPAACAAVDCALWDIFGQVLEQPLVGLWGRRHDGIPTSVTVGIGAVEDSLREATDYLAQGFTILKVKIGQSVQDDIARLQELRAHVGANVGIRVDANEGYTADDLRLFLSQCPKLHLEMCEQPVPRGVTLSSPTQDSLPFYADESVQTPGDAWRLSPAASGYDGFNIKLMKCGGIFAAREIAKVAAHAGKGLMWGCMDESVISITAALHAAYASQQTRFLDLDGSFDLADDLATGGFRLQDGKMYLLEERPGLGVELRGS